MQVKKKNRYDAADDDVERISDFWLIFYLKYIFFFTLINAIYYIYISFEKWLFAKIESFCILTKRLFKLYNFFKDGKLRWSKT